MNEIHLTEDERDCLQELMNIAFGSATAAISKIIDRFATLDIPKIRTVSVMELKKHFIEKLNKHDSLFLASQLINGDIAGENLFVLDKVSAENLLREFDFEEDEINEYEIKDIVLEITNILSSSTSAKLADLVDATISFSSPTVTNLKSINECNKQFNEEYENIIIISTNLQFQDQHISGELVLMTKKESSIYLKKALNAVLEEF